jgi:hypothetical protein
VGLQREVAGGSGFFRSSICGVICNLVATVLLKSKKNDLSMHKDLMGRLNKLAVPEKRPRYRNATFVLVCFLLLLNDALIAFHFSSPLSTFLHRSFQAKQIHKITNVSFNSEVQYKIRGNHQASKFYAVLQRTAESSSSNPTTVKASSAKQHINGMEAAANTAAHNDDDEKVSSDMSSAMQRFFLGKDHGPRIIVLAIGVLLQIRLGNSLFLTSSSSLEALGPLTVADLIAALSAMIFWWFQEHFMHRHMLHSKLDWIGKAIHEHHHNKPYFSISIDPPSLILGWFAVVFLILITLSPKFSIAVSAMIGYSIAGLFYEWTHYIVHTRVVPKNPFFRRVRDHHMRHHLFDDRYWFAFTLPQIDNLFKTNPDVKEIVKLKKHGKETTLPR